MIGGTPVETTLITTTLASEVPSEGIVILRMDGAKNARRREDLQMVLALRHTGAVAIMEAMTNAHPLERRLLTCRRWSLALQPAEP